MNTSERMIMSVYLGLSDQTLVERHKRIYGNMNIIKYYPRLNKFDSD